jgi:flagellar biosynthesis protein FliP
MKTLAKYLIGILLLNIILFGLAADSSAISLPTIQFGMEDSSETEKVSSSLKVLFLLTILTLMPSFLIMMTSFTRVVIVLSFLRQAMGTQQTPPTQILVGLALFLSFYIMEPVWTDVNKNALQPYLNEQISQTEAMDKAQVPIKGFMAKQTRQKDLALFINLSSGKKPKTPKDIPIQALIPAFIISELKTAFQIGFLIYIPFLILDMVVASVLLSMGMMMLPPVLISLPFKLMLFVMVDGWYLTVGSLMKSFA